LISCIHNIFLFWAFSHSENFLHLLDPPFCFMWMTLPIELRGMIPVILSKFIISHYLRWWRIWLKGLAVLHKVCPMLLRLSLLVNLLLNSLHHLVVRQGLLSLLGLVLLLHQLLLMQHLCSNVSIRPSMSPSVSRHFVLTVIYKVKLIKFN